MQQFIFESEKEVICRFGDAKIKLMPNIQKSVEISENKSFVFEFYLEAEKSIIEICKLDFDGERYLSQNKNVKLIKLENNLYFVKFLTKNTKILQKKVKKVAKNDLFFNFYQNGLVEIETNNDLKFCENFDFEMIDAEVLELKNNCYALKLFGTQNADKSIVVNDNFASVLSFESAVLEASENGFKVLTNLYDIAKHGLVEVFEIDSDIKKIDEYSVYLSGSPQKEFNENVLPIYFLQCIKANDFRLAKECLSFELASKTRPEHLKAYFGDFVDILTFDEKIYLVYQNSPSITGGICNTAKSFNFEVQDAKIKNIT